MRRKWTLDTSLVREEKSLHPCTRFIDPMQGVMHGDYE